MEEKYLPVGTVVKLKEGVKAIMITGFCAISGDDGKMYDYSACLYPEGVVGPEMNFLFNHDQIAEILHRGLMSEEEVAFKQKLNQIIAEKVSNGELPTSDNVNNVPNEQPVMPTPVASPAVNQPQMFNSNPNFPSNM